MAITTHPKTGVQLNVIDLHRSRLDDAEAETARLLREAGHKVQDIAAMLGTNQGRIMDAIGLTGHDGPNQPSLF